MARPVKRLLAMDGTELYTRASSGARREIARARHALKPPSWRRRDLAASLDKRAVDLAPVIDDLTAGDWRGAHQRLVHHFRTREPRFVLDPAEREPICRTIHDRFPGAAFEAARRAEGIASGRFDLLGYRALTFGPENGEGQCEIDWHRDPVHECRAPELYWTRVPFLDPSCGDHKIIWELNRHQHWLALGRACWLTNEPRGFETFAAELQSWMAANPPLTGINWASMLELALRSLSWIWALHFFVAVDSTQRESTPPREAAPWTIDILLGLDRQLSLVEHNLSTYFSPNTHLLGEALALYVAGRSLPELARAATWERLGREVLVEQIGRQIRTDGGHAELSPHYHRYTLDFYLLALAVARRTDDAAVDAFTEAAAALARFARTMADSSGRLPQIGDDDGGMLLPMCSRDCADVTASLAVAAALVGDASLALGMPAEETVWMTGALPRSQPLQQASDPLSTALEASGYFVSRSAHGDHLIVDAGPHGFLNGGHAHADALSLTLTVAGVPVLVDPGTGCYTVDPAVRERFRSSQYHNTLTLDDRSQSIADGPFHWSSTANGRAHAWRSTAAFDYFDGSHDGYLPIVHRRTIVARPGCWIVVDRVAGSGCHRIDRHWHLDPSWRTSASESGAICADHPSGGRIWLLSPDTAFEPFTGAAGPEPLGWCAPCYGVLMPTTTLRTTVIGELPVTLVTAIVDCAREPVLDPLPLVEDGRPAPLGAALHLRTDDWADTLLFAPPDGPVTSQWRPRRRAGGLETDAAFLGRRICRRSGADALMLVDGRMAREVEGLMLVDLPDAAAEFHTNFASDSRLSAAGR